MDRKKFLTALITIIISVAILVVIINIIFNSNNINQGKFRISDVVLTSTALLSEKQTGDNTWKFDVSQSNKLSILLSDSKSAGIKEIYLEDVKASSRNDVNIYLEQANYGISYKLDKNINKINIYTEEQSDSSKLIEMDIINKDILKDYIVPNTVKEIRHDGTIFSIANVRISDITFKVKAKLVVVENDGRENICKISIDMPNEALISQGQMVERLELEKFSFKVDI